MWWENPFLQSRVTRNHGNKLLTTDTREGKNGGQKACQEVSKDVRGGEGSVPRAAKAPGRRDAEEKGRNAHKISQSMHGKQMLALYR